VSNPKVTFGFVNCNRLHYLKSCIESLLLSTADFESKELIIVDNASVEPGTEEYLSSLEDRGFIVVRRESRDPANEFAQGLNTVCEMAQGEFVVPLQGDMQFVLSSQWLHEYVRYAEAHPELVGCITLDAQRTVTNSSHKYAMDESYDADYQFVVDLDRDPVAGAADVFYPRAVLDAVYPWRVQNEKHEGGNDSETAMLQKVRELLKSGELQWRSIMPIVPPAIAINTDPRGTNARIRGNRRYGQYWPPKEDNYRYYEVIDFEYAVKTVEGRQHPVGIEEIVEPVGFPKFVDENGHWLKNPIRPDAALPGEYEELEPTLLSPLPEIVIAEGAELDEWLNS